MEVNVDGVTRSVECERCLIDSTAHDVYYRVTVWHRGLGKNFIFDNEDQAMKATRSIVDILNDVLVDAKQKFEE
jgi:hypothetical protein